MRPEWVAAIAAVIVILVYLLKAAVIYGSLQRQVKNNSESIVELKEADRSQWRAINGHTAEISYLQGSQGVNDVAMSKECRRSAKMAVNRRS